ncbi:M48 family metallopeptidase [Faunimonas sp. B44]|uniref:M48 family metallopeptidase n=1 Tax=Faunimonas sp. B44 TaxID=3461493 RepID=UPI0040445A77
MRFALKRGPERLSIEIDGRLLEIGVRRSDRARRLILRIDPAAGAPVLTLPRRVPLKEGERFLARHAGWVAARLGRMPAAIPFAPEGQFPLRGEPCRIVHRPGRGLVRHAAGAEGPLLEVPGEVEHVPRRVRDWLRREARRDLERAVAGHAAAVGRLPAALRIGDARSRWGSCTAQGVLTFSWRLILAPPPILDYLAAHEVAHLREMNHGAGFWRLVGALDPDFDAARQWLKRHGPALHAVGRA